MDSDTARSRAATALEECVDMHTKDARAKDETEQRLYSVSTWHESPFFSPAERAALALTDALTLLPGNPLPDAVVQRERRPRCADVVPVER